MSCSTTDTPPRDFSIMTLGGMKEKRIIDESTLPVACLTILSQTIGMSFIELGNSVPKKKLAFWKVSRHLAKSALDPVTVIQN